MCVCVFRPNMLVLTCLATLVVGVLLQQAGKKGGSPMEIVNEPTPGTTDHRKNALRQIKDMFLPIFKAHGNAGN